MRRFTVAHCCGVVWLFVSLLAASVAAAEDRWVTDEFEVMLRTGKSTDKAILRQLKSGTRVEALEDDKAEGYTLVRMDSGVEGWVLTRYLQRAKTGRLQAAELQAKAQADETRLAELQSELAAVSEERQQLRDQLAEVQGDYTSNSAELDRIKALSSGTIKVDEQNKQLTLKLVENQKRLDELEAANSRLASSADRQWFLIGGAVLGAGLLMGLIIPRIRWRKKSSWSSL